MMVSNEERLQTENAFLRASIESFKDVLIFCIDRDYRYRIFNKTFSDATLAAYGTSVTSGMSMLDSIPNAEDREKAKRNCDLALAGTDHVTEETYGDLVRLFFETRYLPIHDDQGEVIGVSVLSTDITHRKNSETKLIELNKEMETFSYTASHDLRTPLRGIKSLSQMLVEDHGDQLDPEARHLLDAIGHNIDKMSKLIDALLNYSRLGRKEINIVQVDMDVVVNHALWETFLQEEYPNTTLTVPPMLPAMGDPVLLQQVWVNLISNALKYTGKNPAPTIEIGSEETGNAITYSITDNGVGFDMQYYGKIFGVFQRLHTSEEFEGTGVGLAIVQKIVQGLGGRIWAESEVDNGARFYFTLPKVK
jgi:signal transduction histidine kinase